MSALPGGNHEASFARAIRIFLWRTRRITGGGSWFVLIRFPEISPGLCSQDTIMPYPARRLWQFTSWTDSCFVSGSRQTLPWRGNRCLPSCFPLPRDTCLFSTRPSVSKTPYLNLLGSVPFCGFLPPLPKQTSTLLAAFCALGDLDIKLVAHYFSFPS